jgi:hypothetical protein
MKLKLLLFFLFVVSFSIVLQAQTKKPYNNLIITEALTASTPDCYVEFTNMGTETIDLSQFEYGKITPWNDPWTPGDANSYFRLPKKMLAPGKSYLISTAYVFGPKMWFKDPLHYSERITKPEFFKIADQLLYVREANSTANDTVTPYYSTMDCWGGRETWYLRHHFINEAGAKDSVVIDQVGGVFDQSNGRNKDGAYDVAGVLNATRNSILIRKASVKTGNVDFNAGRGLDLADSEWIPVPMLSIYDWRAVFWTAGNQAVGAKLDANTLVSKTPGKIKVDLDKAEITVPWGIRRNDSIMYQFERKPGLAWAYELSPNSEDSAYISMRTGDKLRLYVCGDEGTIKDFNIIVKAPTADDNIVIYKRAASFTTGFYGAKLPGNWGYRVSDGVKGMDTISFVPYATRVDTLYKYLEKPTKASWKIVYKSGVVKPDLATGDKLQVTSESGKVKEYYLKLEKFVPSATAELASITWPDMPAFFKGDVAKSYGWAGDTIPGFVPTKKSYVVKIPLGYEGIPALTYSKRDLNAKVTVIRAKSLAGSAEDRTVTYKCVAEDDSTKTEYTVRFEVEKDPSKVQPWKGEPFFSQIIFQDSWGVPWVEIANPGTEILDLSHYMIFCNYSGPASAFDAFNAVGTSYSDGPWRKYVPGKKWQDEASWAVQPRILQPDLAVNAIVYPGEVFVMTQHGGGGDYTDPVTKKKIGSLEIFGKNVNVNFATGKNPWGYSMPWNNAIHDWMGTTYYMYKILNDSVVNGLKPATDITDFELIDVFGKGDGKNWVIGGKQVNQITAYTRKPGFYKGNIELGGSWGTTSFDDATCEWTMTDQAYWDKKNTPWPLNWYNICTGIGSHILNDVTMYRSTVASKIYKVSEGYSKKETIKGLTTGTTVTGFYGNLIKADEKQTLTVKSAASGKELALTDAIAKGDSLIVLSADSTNISKYILDVTAGGLSSNALLTSTKYTINVTGSTGTISGIKQRELLKNVYSAVVVPAGATLTITDVNDAYMSLTKLNYDSAYVNVIATDKVYFEVVAENGTTKISYQLKPTVNPSDAYVTSDVYSVDQFASLIQFVPAGTTVQSLINNVYPCAGATLQIFDKAGFARTNGDVYKDDKLIVTSADGKVTKAYYFSMLNFNVNKYLAYVISDDYVIDQVKLVIKVPSTGLDIATFYAKLYPSFGAKLSIIDKNGATSTLTKLASYDKLLVTAADNSTTATYKIEFATSVSPIETSIKMYPNPTTDKVVVNGLTPGYRLQVFNAVGVALRDVIVENSTDYVSLSAQPAGVYVFVISSDDKFVNIQKVIKK